MGQAPERHPAVLAVPSRRPRFPALPSEPREPRRPRSSAAAIGICVLLVLFALDYASAVLIPIAIASLLAIVLSPVVRGLHGLGLPTPLGAVIAIAGLLAIAAGTFQLLAQPAERWFARLPMEMQRLEYKLRHIKQPMEDLRAATDRVGEMTELGKRAGAATVEVRTTTPTLTDLIVSTTPGLLAAVAMIIILALYVLAAGDDFLRRLVRSLDAFADKRRAVEVVRGIQYQLSRYLLMHCMINAVLGAVTSLALWLLDVPNPLLWGVMAAVLNFAPYLGPIVTTVVLAVVGLLTFELPVHALSVPGVYLVLTIIEGQFVTPVVLGRHLALSPLAVILSLILWGWLWGIAGILMAVPLLACCKVFCEEIEPLRGIALFLERRPERSPSE